jgi:hypothetical protein
MSNTILQVIKFDPELMKEIKLSFNSLPETDHADGSYRLRKYSHVECNSILGMKGVVDLGFLQFTQSSKYNKHQGGMARNFSPIDSDVLNSDIISDMVNVFRDKCSLPDQFEMDIHQMRVKCKGGATQLSPEGWHQDGYDRIAMIGVDRHNIIGGEVALSISKTASPFLSAVMDTGTMVILDDNYLWHNGRAIQPINDNEPAHMDVIVFTAKRSQ